MLSHFERPAILVDMDFWRLDSWNRSSEEHGSTFAKVNSVKVRGMDRIDNVSEVEEEIKAAIDGILDRHQK